MMLDNNGTKVAHYHYYAWGSNLTTWSGGETKYQFTGQMNDGDTGLYYYNARYYESALARFVQADTIVPEPGNPQMFNRYSYGLNNPARYTDPTGHCIDGLTTAACIIAGITITALIVDYGITLVDAYHYHTIMNDPNASPEAREEAASQLLMTLGAEAIEPDFGISLPLDDLARHGIIALGAEAAQNLPKGFKNVEEFIQFGQGIKQGLSNLGWSDVQVIFQGSSVTGVKYTTGDAWDVGRISDYDVALASKDLLERARELGIELRGAGTRTGPLREEQLRLLGLYDLHIELSEQIGRPVNFMIYESAEAAINKGPSIPVP